MRLLPLLEGAEADEEEEEKEEEEEAEEEEDDERGGRPGRRPEPLDLRCGSECLARECDEDEDDDEDADTVGGRFRTHTRIVSASYGIE